MKNTSVWECENCGSQFPKWAGQCLECHKWNSLVETPIYQTATAPVKRSRISNIDTHPVEWRKVTGADTLHRPTSIAELDRVLGGGLVLGGVMLIAGEPGIGKSTLLSQLALTQTEALYVNGEESNAQVANRFKRLSPKSKSRIALFPDTNIDNVVSNITADHQLVIVDSIQVMFSPQLRSAPGSISQIRECALKLIDMAKTTNVPIILVGHFTKSGEVAGPKLLEHMVDSVIVLEGERSGNFRILRAVKNRFGPVDEVGLFAMEEGGMREVSNPAQLLIGEMAGHAQGSVLGCILEGQRPLVLEVQALVVPSKLAVPRRIGHGIKERRLQLLCAVIEKHLGLGIGEKDVFLNVAGGLSSPDPGLDLAVVAAVVSGASQRTKAKRESLIPIFCGEVGLLGEVRMVQGWDRRQKEVKRLGLGQLIGKNEIPSIHGLSKFSPDTKG